MGIHILVQSSLEAGCSIPANRPQLNTGTEMGVLLWRSRNYEKDLIISEDHKIYWTFRRLRKNFKIKDMFA